MNEFDRGAIERAKRVTVPDDLAHYMESTSRLRAEKDELDAIGARLMVERNAWRSSATRAIARAEDAEAEADARMDAERVEWTKRERAEATLREVAEELRQWGKHTKETWCFELADRLDPPPKEDR